MPHQPSEIVIPMVLMASATTDASYEFVVTTTQHSIRDANNPASAKASVKLVLLDEADAMTKDAQFALRRVIEKYTKSTRFALICNHVNKIIPALQSRCTRFQFAPLDAINVSEQLKHVIQAERLDVPECGLKALVRLSNGDMRKALNILQFKLLLQPTLGLLVVLLKQRSCKTFSLELLTNWVCAVYINLEGF